MAIIRIINSKAKTENNTGFGTNANDYGGKTVLDLDKFSKESSSEYSANKKVKDKIKATRPKNLDAKFHQAHEQVFEKLDCLDCANCCKTTSPILIHTDIDRLSKVFRMRSSEFIDSYLFRDEEGDYVFKGAPCPFLGADNRCCLLYTSPSPRDRQKSRMPSSA